MAAQQSFKKGCGWAVELAEGISYFETAFEKAFISLDDLKEMADQHQLDDHSNRVIDALKKLNTYSQVMKMDKEPLTAAAIITATQGLYDISDELERLATEAKALMKSRRRAKTRRPKELGRSA